MPEKDRVMKQWDDAAESWASFVRKHKDYYRDELNNPATFRLTGNVKDKLVLDWHAARDTTLKYCLSCAPSNSRVHRSYLSTSLSLRVTC